MSPIQFSSIPVSFAKDAAIVVERVTSASSTGDLVPSSHHSTISCPVSSSSAMMSPRRPSASLTIFPFVSGTLNGTSCPGFFGVGAGAGSPASDLEGTPAFLAASGFPMSSAKKGVALASPATRGVRLGGAPSSASSSLPSETAAASSDSASVSKRVLVKDIPSTSPKEDTIAPAAASASSKLTNEGFSSGTGSDSTVVGLCLITTTTKSPCAPVTIAPLSDKIDPDRSSKLPKGLRTGFPAVAFLLTEIIWGSASGSWFSKYRCRSSGSGISVFSAA